MGCSHLWRRAHSCFISSGAGMIDLDRASSDNHLHAAAVPEPARHAPSGLQIAPSRLLLWLGRWVPTAKSGVDASLAAGLSRPPHAPGSSGTRRGSEAPEISRFGNVMMWLVRAREGARPAKTRLELGYPKILCALICGSSITVFIAHIAQLSAESVLGASTYKKVQRPPNLHHDHFPTSSFPLPIRLSIPKVSILESNTTTAFSDRSIFVLHNASQSRQEARLQGPRCCL